MLGGVIVAGCTMPMVEYFGQGDAAKGYQYTMTAMSILGFVLFLLCFLGTKERIQQPKEQNIPFAQSVKALIKNDQWRTLCLAAFFLLTGQVLRLTLAVYYVKYYLGRDDLITLFMTLGVAASMLGCALAQPLAKRFCKIKAYISLQVIAAAICGFSYFISKDSISTRIYCLYFMEVLFRYGNPVVMGKNGRHHRLWA